MILFENSSYKKNQNRSHMKQSSSDEILELLFFNRLSGDLGKASKS